jgi:phosphoribosylamine-glycine ligase
MRTANGRQQAAACSTSPQKATRFSRRIERAYAGVDQIDWPQGVHRRDIGWRALK